MSELTKLSGELLIAISKVQSYLAMDRVIKGNNVSFELTGPVPLHYDNGDLHNPDVWWLSFKPVKVNVSLSTLTFKKGNYLNENMIKDLVENVNSILESQNSNYRTTLPLNPYSDNNNAIVIILGKTENIRSFNKKMLGLKRQSQL